MPQRQDVTIKTRALELLTGMVTKQNLEELIHKLLRHVVTAKGMYRDELIQKIIFMYSRDKCTYLSDFAWYLSVLVDLATIQGNRHGELVALQLMDVAVRVAPVRPFAVEHMMGLLLDERLMRGSGRNTLYEVLYAAAWIVGESGTLIPVSTVAWKKAARTSTRPTGRARSRRAARAAATATATVTRTTRAPRGWWTSGRGRSRRSPSASTSTTRTTS